MTRRFAILVAVAISALIVVTESRSQFLFDPSVHKLEDMEPLILGAEDNSFHMEPKEYRLKVGQGYRWEIKAETDFEYGFVAPEFFRNVFLRKIELEDAEIKTRSLEEIKFEDVGEAEIIFVAIRPGTYEFGVRNMMERGMVGKIIVEGSAD